MDPSLKSLNSNCLQHKYGNWSSSLDNNLFNYTRTCKSCGHVERICSHEAIDDIENEVTRAIKAKEIVNFFVNSSNEDLTEENILDYLVTTYEFHSYMDFNPIIKKLYSLGYDFSNNIPDNTSRKLIYDVIFSLESKGYIPQDLSLRTLKHLIVDNAEFKGRTL